MRTLAYNNYDLNKLDYFRTIIQYNKDGSIRWIEYWVNGEKLTEEEFKIYRLPDTKIKRALYK